MPIPAAGPDAPGNIVSVGPPLLARGPRVPSSVGEALMSLGLLNPQDPSSSMFHPDDAIGPSQAFSVPLAKWFRGSMGRALEHKLQCRNEFYAASYIESAIVRRLIEEHRKGRADHSRVLWQVWMLELFLEREQLSSGISSSVLDTTPSSTAA